MVAADLNRPVILAEIAPGRYNLIDGHHRVAKARRDGVPSIPAYRVRCPEHVAFLTSTRGYEAYVEYWNSKVDDASEGAPPLRRTRGNRGRRGALGCDAPAAPSLSAGGQAIDAATTAAVSYELIGGEVGGPRASRPQRGTR